ncbi:MAG: hypothetical protein EA379_02225 [Phycisphaerales bacterium]|nr:MAG: hypothetical protein EA379_02225 [Phycisphaerales bacterium]
MTATPTRRRLGVLLVVLFGVLSGHGANASPYSDLAEIIRRAIHGPEERADAALLALRQLRDPALRPFFAQLAASDRDDHRLHGVLGVGELEQPPALDLFLVSQLNDAAEQTALISSARNHGMLADDAVEELLARPGLPPVLEAYLHLLNARKGEPATEARLRALLDAESLLTSGRAALLLHDAGQSELASPVLERIMLDDSTRGEWRIALLLQDIRTSDLSSAAGLAHRAYDKWSENGALRSEALFTLMSVAPETGTPLWADAYGASDDLARRLRLALIALEAHQHTPDTIFSTLASQTDQSLLSTIGKAGLALREEGRARVEPLLALARTRYTPGIAWLVAVSAELPDDEAVELLTELSGLPLSSERLGVELMDQAVVAASRLAARDPAVFANLLRDSETEQRDAHRLALLLGLLRDVNAPRPEDVLESYSPPDAESRALTALLHAQREGALSEDRLDRLRRVAFGWGGLSHARRVQAAWMLLRREGHDRAAIARILTEMP